MSNLITTIGGVLEEKLSYIEVECRGCKRPLPNAINLYMTGVEKDES